MKSHANHGAKGVAKAGIIATGARLGTRIVHTAAKYPVLVFGIGVVAGYYLYKNRHQVIESGNRSEE